ncbi:MULTISPECIES: thioredoxin family protein [unclassified Sphingobacterium]|uniref:thioredoxin family protein n=1 Tax=unclassified Sphingobacterium TaxID=2609468 RepID=UPI0025EB53CF|nr:MULTISPECIES: thioredoxin family protein [unclassified Sphingobacterium]
MKALLLNIIFLSCLVSVQAQTKQEINWLTFEQLSDSLDAKPKETLLFFYTDWCSYCHKMMKEGFQDPDIVRYINTHYYAVRFDAESISSVTFDGQLLKNASKHKAPGHFHEVALLFNSPRKKLIFPQLILLKNDFSIKKNTNKYLSSKELLKYVK